MRTIAQPTQAPRIVPLSDDPEQLMRDNPFKALILGKPGTGKTHLVTTLPDDFFPVALVELDGKAISMPILRPYRAAGLIDICSVNLPILSEFSGARATKNEKITGEPIGFIKAIDAINYFTGSNRLAAQHRDQGIFKEYRSIWIDPFSFLAQHIDRAAQYAQSAEGLKSGWGDWGKYNSIIEEFLSKVVTAASGQHVFMTCHVMEREKIIKGTTNTKIHWSIAIDGKMKDLIAGYFNEVYSLNGGKRAAGAGTNALTYDMQVRPTERIPARTNITNLPDPCPADMKIPIELWRRQMLSNSYDVLSPAQKELAAKMKRMADARAAQTGQAQVKST